MTKSTKNKSNKALKDESEQKRLKSLEEKKQAFKKQEKIIKDALSFSVSLSNFFIHKCAKQKNFDLFSM